MSEIINNTIRKYIKLLKRRKTQYTFRQAFDLVCAQIKQEQAMNDADMEGLKDEIWSRLNDNWPFTDII